MPLPPIDGVDAQYGFCQNWPGSVVRVNCYLLPAKGDYAIVGDIFAFLGDTPGPPALLPRLIPLLTTALGRV
jgi:hypothetical protein